MPATDEAAPPPHAADLSDSLLALLRTLSGQPCHHARHARALAARLLDALAGKGDLDELRDDPRFQHPAWRQPLHRRLLLAWLGCSRQNQQWLAGLDLPETDRTRLNLLCRQLEHALAPSNSPFNPLILERVRQTGGRNLCRGANNLATDLILRRPLPPLNGEDAFLVGRDLATSAGRVVLRQPMFELIQYQPTTTSVHARPLLIIPPPINRYYLLDLTPDTSLVRHALDQGLQVFLISWRNPNPSHCDWGFEQYVHSAKTALRAASQISRSPQLSLLGVCAGGLLSLLLQGLLQARDDTDGIAAASYLVTPLDARLDTDLLRLAGPRARQLLRQRVWRQGYMSERQMSAAFAWLRPDQLVWPQALQRYVLGQDPEPQPLLFWNQDTTRLPARLVDDLLDMAERDPLRRPGGMSIAGVPIDPARIQTPSWHLGAQRDHIVPWTNSFPGTRLGGDKLFIQCHSGHIQSLVNPPGHPRAWYRSARVEGDDSEAWLASATQQAGSWWQAWSDWLKALSGPLQPASDTLGNPQYPAQDAAPGRYVHQL